MTPQTQLRTASAADLSAILALDRATQDAPHWPLSSYTAILEVGDQSETGEQSAEVSEERNITLRRCLFVAYCDTLLVGLAVALVHPAPPNPAPPNPDTPCIAELESVVVASAARRAGIGRALCSAVLSWCRAHGATQVILEVRAASAAASALYAALGFTQTGRRPDYYRNPSDDAVVMRLLLADRPTYPQAPGGVPA